MAEGYSPPPADRVGDGARRGGYDLAQMPRLRALALAAATLALAVAALLAATGPQGQAPGSPGSGGDVAAATSTPPGTPAGASREPAATRVLPTTRPVPAGTLQPRVGLQPGSVDRTSLAVEATYDVALSLAFDTRRIRVDSHMTAINRSGSGIDRLELNTVAARLGGLHVTAASVDGRPIDVTIDDQTLVVPFGGILPPGASVPIRIAFDATLRADTAGHSWMFTRANGIAELYRWLPWVSRRLAFDRPNIGDPWVTPVSPRVRVAITTDRPLVIAAPGDRLSASALTQTFEASNVRDFSIAASPDYRTGSAVVGDTTIRVYYRPGAPGSTYLAQAKAAIERMEPFVGEYPYGTYRVAQSAGGYAIESPGVTWIPTGAPAANLPYLVHHETAHQWFYGIVGADQANEPFTDEAAADFLARHVLGTRRGSRCATARLDLSIYRYSAACYYEVIYIQGGNYLNDLRVRMGPTAFWTGLRAWVAANRFKIAPTKSLLDTLDAHTPLDLVPRYEPRFPRLY
jgi:hypothetical protein